MTHAPDALLADALNERIYHRVVRAFFPVSLAFSAAPYPIIFLEPGEPGRYGYEIGTWFIRAFFVVFAQLLAWAIVRSRGPLEQAVLYIDRNAIRVTRGRYDRTVARAAVRSTYLGPTHLRFEPALGDRIRDIGIIRFGWRELDQALRRHGWNVTSRPR